ncbi:hypothetical protein [Micromonospora sp. 4G55]|uniref:hypothetical protein n=1 Tax=Micromonospora sp. 4G55 TaxID=2806102 RepID=UPI001A42EBB6|nr:hypothetical protein [Micromonospora sp. 4G55]MBM0258957.1 hypothetical protein [Micromonospora sp. 4G55]
MSKLEEALAQAASTTFDRAVATKRKIDFSFNGSLSWPEGEWYAPETGREQAAQDAIRGARKQGLPDRIEDPATVDNLAVLVRKR